MTRSLGKFRVSNVVDFNWSRRDLHPSKMSLRKASIARKTNETDVNIALSLDAEPGVNQQINVSTGIGFLDHVCQPQCRVPRLAHS